MLSTLSVDKTWQLADALDLIRTMQPHVKPIGFHICMGGSVLNTGSSKKDLDLYFLPLTNVGDPIQSDKLIAFLTETWGPGRPMASPSKKRGVGGLESFYDENGQRRLRTVQVEPERDYPTDGNESIYTHKLKFTWSDLRIDVFVLGASAAKAAEAKPAEASLPAVAADPAGGGWATLPDRPRTRPDFIPMPPDALAIQAAAEAAYAQVDALRMQDLRNNLRTFRDMYYLDTTNQARTTTNGG